MSGRAALVELVARLGGARVLVVGDAILDRYEFGTVDRISPEAPIPVLTLGRRDTVLGGAGNVLRNLVTLGTRARLITAVGDDDVGRHVIRLVESESAEPSTVVVDPGRVTSEKTRFIAGTQQLLRADRETVAPLGAQARARLVAAANREIADAAIIVLSDYGKGTLGAGIAADIIAAARDAGKPVVVDPKGIDYSRYKGAFALTPNRRELGEATGMPVATDAEIIAAAKSLIAALGLEALVATRSRDGMTLVTRDSVTHLKAEAREVFDVTGAGDTVMATLAAALASGAAIDAAAALANVAAGVVVSKLGAAVAHVSEILTALHHEDAASAETKVLTLGPAQDRIRLWRQTGLTVGFTNGCFDLLHPGHISLINQAKADCDRLIVGLNSDASVKRLKGAGRPLQGEAARATVLASLAAVDLVIVFDDDTPLATIEAVRPDLLVKGSDWAPDKVVGADRVKRWGGTVKLAKLEPGHSTTATIARMAR
ncbi:MAG: D-glycero-beta-D-manno-heptose-7-phosphate kinase [Rhodospirillales bacterium]|nr:D-glycero-beta-D-manno-heptose-7-phosphate kinase [Rhodospirillales bacterium]